MTDQITPRDLETMIAQAFDQYGAVEVHIWPHKKAVRPTHAYGRVTYEPDGFTAAIVLDPGYPSSYDDPGDPGIGYEVTGPTPAEALREAFDQMVAEDEEAIAQGHTEGIQS